MACPHVGHCFSPCTASAPHLPEISLLTSPSPPSKMLVLDELSYRCGYLIMACKVTHVTPNPHPKTNPSLHIHAYPHAHSKADPHPHPIPNRISTMVLTLISMMTCKVSDVSPHPNPPVLVTLVTACKVTDVNGRENALARSLLPNPMAPSSEKQASHFEGRGWRGGQQRQKGEPEFGAVIAR